MLVWASTTAVGCAAVMLGLGGLLGLAGATPWPGLDRALVGMALTALLALPFALVATIGRSALGGVGAVIGVIVVTQILTVVATGPWFPYSAPSLWLGMGGPDVTVSTAQLCCCSCCPWPPPDGPRPRCCGDTRNWPALDRPRSEGVDTQDQVEGSGPTSVRFTRLPLTRLASEDWSAVEVSRGNRD